MNKIYLSIILSISLYGYNKTLYLDENKSKTSNQTLENLVKDIEDTNQTSNKDHFKFHEKSVILDTISVTANNEQDISEKKVGEITKSAKELSKQQVSDTRDMVRYETGISVVETGRMGTSGYTVRGVDENRVAINIDGLNQAESLSSQGFKELFEGYGNFNNTRNGIEIENVKRVNITKGADSIKTGSGALGGSVMFETKDARDYLINKNWHYGFKLGYSTKNSEWLRSHTLAAKVKWFDFLVIKTDRDAKETKNWGYFKYDNSIRGRTREKADPYQITKNGTLVKIGFMPNEEHRISFINDNYQTKSQGSDYQYMLYASAITSGVANTILNMGDRYTDDLSKRTNRGVMYENFSENPFWDYMKFSYYDQRITQRARTDEYCKDNNCATTANLLGLKVDRAKVVNKDGSPLDVVYEVIPNGSARLMGVKTKDNKTDFTAIKNLNINTFALDCSIFDCSGEIDLYRNNQNKDGVEKITLNLKDTEHKQKIGDKDYIFTISQDEDNGKKYKKIKAESTFKNWLGDTVREARNDINIILPNSKGFIPRDWKERDLNTQTKQFNLDFYKNFELIGTQHDLSYGAIYSKNEKSMVNRSGFDTIPKTQQWWANSYKGECLSGDSYDELRCPKTSPEYSFLIPVKSKNGTLHLADNMRLNDYIGLNLAYRYDKIRYSSNYIAGKTPAIPDDMVKGLFIPFATNPLTRPNYYDYAQWDEYVAARDLYEAKQKEVDELNAKNSEKNIEYFSKPKEYKNNSYAFGFDLDPFEFLRIQTKYSKAFRAPTTDELYFTFKHPDFTIKPNVDLKPEIAKTKEVAFTFHNNSSFITISRFKTSYENFLDLKFIGREHVNDGHQSGYDYDIYQNINRQKAEVSGMEINSKLYFSDITNYLDGLYIGYKFTRQKGKMLTDKDGFVPLNPIQPKKSIYNIGYLSKNEKYGVDLYITDVAAKKADDTYNMFWDNEKEKGDKINGKLVNDYSSHWLSDKYKIIDIVAHAKPVKNLTFSFGIYNLSNEKYMTWESARSVRSFGTMNMVRKSDSLGINRFLAPGRNYKLNFEMTF